MERHDHETMVRWLDEALDGSLDASRRRELAEHLAGCEACRDEEVRGSRLVALLAEDRIPVRAGFSARVMEALPAAPWERSSARSWGWAVACLLMLCASSILLLAGSGVSGTGPFGLVATVGDLFASALLAGAGLLGASWRGVGLVLREVLVGSPVTFVVFGFTVVAIHLLLWRLLRPRSGAAVRSTSSSSRE